MTTPQDLWRMTKTLGRALRTKPLPETEPMSFGRLIADNAAAFPDRPFLSCDDEALSWGAFNARANRVANRLAATGVERGDCVAMMLDNRTEFLTTLIGINKLGAVAGLINTNQRRDVLEHSASIIDAKRFVFGAEHREAVDEVRGELSLGDGDFLFVPDGDDREAPAWAESFDSRDPGASDANPEATEAVTQEDACFYVFTSGTTGKPKAAILRNQRLFRAMQGYGRICLNATGDSKLYNCLPLYHSTGLIVGFASIAYAGGAMFLRRKFSASSFLEDARREGTDCFVYVGELCRYLLSQDERPNDADNPVRRIIGNGLRPDIWTEFKRRFGIEEVYEIYGASEGNSGFVNAFNKDCTIGFGVTPHRLVRFDVDRDEIVRGANGFCIEVEKGQPGLLLNEVSKEARFDGYTNAEATEKKLVRDVMKAGDVYFNTGDLVRQIDVGFAFGRPHYQFVDRTGDTFRWKGENCSTNEVGEILNGFGQVETANVYGVRIPGTDGRAGMAAITLEGGERELDRKAFSDYVNEMLPSYARPVFVRIRPEQPNTSTFKLQKTELRDEAFHLDRLDGDPLYVLKPGSAVYELLDRSFYEELVAGRARY